MSAKSNNLVNFPKDAVVLHKYNFKSNGIPINISIVKLPNDFVPTYFVSVARISEHTELILDEIRDELISELSVDVSQISSESKHGSLEQSFKRNIEILIRKYFPDLDEEELDILTAYMIQKCLGMGRIEILRDDHELEEIAINCAKEPIWIYHRRFGWLKTNVYVRSEDQIKHFSTMIGRKVDRQISLLYPLMDANLATGERVNATLAPISLKGNTITLRRFASKPWTITDFLSNETVSVRIAALLWLCVEYDLSMIIAGGTASGKTSMLNVVANFFPPNQRIISIEDTHEIRLPKFLHWIPMITRVPNPEGKGGITMLDLLVNSLRMRPDKIIVGEIRRQREAEVLFEAMHTGHSVYATVHANTAKEAVTRLTSPPINIPKSMLPAISVILVQYRNRRTGIRKTFELAEVTEKGEAQVLMRFNQSTGKFEETDVLKEAISSRRAKSKSTLFSKLELFTGMSNRQIVTDLKEKEKVLLWMLNQGINMVDEVGKVMGFYYTQHEKFMKLVEKNKPLGD